jgi:predicted phosphodiesterase
MARFIHWSDLHTEFRYMDLPDLPTGIDALLLAGDTGVQEGHLDFLEKAWNKYGIPIISIWGNHEIYGTNFETMMHQEKAGLQALRANGADIRVLHAETTRIKDVTIFGATLWTDYDLYPAQTVFSKLIAQCGMKDFQQIKLDESGTPLSTDHILDMHLIQRAKLIDAMRFHKNDKLIVMTHHMVSEMTVNLKFRNDGLNPAFCSNLESEIELYHPDFWIYGHTHCGIELDIKSENGATRLRHNPRGYPQEGSIFDPYRIIDTENPEMRRLEA